MAPERLEIDANGLTFSARATGTPGERPVLLLHGFPQTSWCWRGVLDHLGGGGYRAVAPDQRGYATFARPDGVEAYRLDHLVADVVGLADTMEWPRFDLVGHDWGAFVAWVVASRHAGRVRSLTSVSTPHPSALRAVAAAGDADQAARSSYIALFRRAAEPEALLLGAEGSGSGLRRLFEGSGVDDGAVDEYVRTLLEPGAMTAALNWYRAMAPADTDGLAPVVVPTLYVWSSDDAALGRAAAERTGEFVAGRYRFEVLDGVNHWVPECAPGPLSRLLVTHLADC